MVDSSEDKQKILQQIQAILNQNTPLLPDSTLHDFVEANFRKGRQILHTIGGHLTPCYLFEPGIVIARAKTFKRAFQQNLPDTGFYFAMKSNNFLDVSKTILGCGFGLDVSSGAELETALELGADDIVFSGPGKTAQELDIAVVNHKKVVVLMDSLSEMKRLEKRAARIGKNIRAGVRLTTEPHGLWRKFGILKEDLQSFINESKRYGHIRLQGIQFHSSWNMGPERQIAFIKELGQTLASLTPEEREIIKFIDIGGGYWPEQGEWLQPGGTPQGVLRNAVFSASSALSLDGLSSSSSAAYPHYLNASTSIETFARELSSAICEHIQSLISCKICFEPGRLICNDSMHIILKVMDKKYDDLVITDGGTNAVGWERFETDYCPILNISRPAMTERECLITGSLCTPHDLWGYSYWGKEIHEGDLLMIPEQGAYTYSLRQNFIKALPQVISFP
ncbi:MAG: alanine racemase [Desulfamplus sp.]|nr:alanine racemase [Desulfamplus sp.]